MFSKLSCSRRWLMWGDHTEHDSIPLPLTSSSWLWLQTKTPVYFHRRSRCQFNREKVFGLWRHSATNCILICNYNKIEIFEIYWNFLFCPALQVSIELIEWISSTYSTSPNVPAGDNRSCHNSWQLPPSKSRLPLGKRRRSPRDDLSTLTALVSTIVPLTDLEPDA